MPDRFVPASERVRGDRVDRAAVLPTILFVDADPDYRAMARDALLEGRSPSDLRYAVGPASWLVPFVRRFMPDAVALRLLRSHFRV